MMYLAAAGLIAPVLFVALVVLQGAVNPDYDQVVMPISGLAAWPTGWIQNLNFYIFGVLMMGHGIALHRGIRSRSGAGLDLALLLTSAVGAIVAGLVPMARDANGTLIEPPGHVAGAIMVFLGAGLGLVVVSRRMSTDVRWRSVAGYTLSSGVAIVALFLLMAALAVPADGALHAWFGLLQRVVLAVWFPCIVVLSLRLVRLTGDAQDHASTISGVVARQPKR